MTYPSSVVLSTAFEISMNSASQITFVTFFVTKACTMVHYNTNPNGPKDRTVLLHTAD